MSTATAEPGPRSADATGRVNGDLAPSRAVVRRRVRESHDVVSLDLDCPDLDDPAPGQFNMLTAPGIGEVPISVSGIRGSDDLIRHTIRAVGAITTALCALDVGDAMGVRGPYGRGWPRADRGDLVVIGGGIGMAPLRPVLVDAVAHGRAAHTALAVGMRTPNELMFGPDLDEWRSAGMRVEVTADVATPGWRRHVGFVTELVEPVLAGRTDVTAFVCGPEAMLAPVVRRLLDAGVTTERIFVSLERDMHCGVGRCGRCLIGPLFVCADGPVVAWDVAAELLRVPRW